AGIGDVEPGGDALAAFRRDEIEGRRAIVDVGGDHPSAGSGKAAREFLAEAAGRSGDRDDLVPHVHLYLPKPNAEVACHRGDARVRTMAAMRPSRRAPPERSSG